MQRIDLALWTSREHEKYGTQDKPGFTRSAWQSGVTGGDNKEKNMETNVRIHEGYVMGHWHEPDERWLDDGAGDAQDERASPALEVVETAVVESAGENVHSTRIDETRYSNSWWKRTKEVLARERRRARMSRQNLGSSDSRLRSIHYVTRIMCVMFTASPTCGPWTRFAMPICARGISKNIPLNCAKLYTNIFLQAMQVHTPYALEATITYSIQVVKLKLAHMKQYTSNRFLPTKPKQVAPEPAAVKKLRTG